MKKILVMTELEKLREENRNIKEINRKLSNDLYMITEVINKCIDLYSRHDKPAGNEINNEFLHILKKYSKKLS